jgi:hypothetical protein
MSLLLSSGNPALLSGESVGDCESATENPLLIHKTRSVAKMSNGESVTSFATDLSIAKKSATTNLHLIFAVADFVAKLF